MIDSLSSFIRTAQNEEACAAIDAMNGGAIQPTKVIIQGPHYSGKSALIRGVGQDAIRNGAEMMLFTCSGFDIVMALTNEADDSFFERLGETPSLLIDEVSGVKRHEKGDQLLSLLLAERDKYNLSTALTTVEPLTRDDFPLSAPLLESYKVIPIEPIDDEGRVAFVRLVENRYRQDTSPTIDDDAAFYIANEFAATFYDMETATRYFMQDEDCAALHTIDAKTAAELLTK